MHAPNAIRPALCINLSIHKAGLSGEVHLCVVAALLTSYLPQEGSFMASANISTYLSGRQSVPSTAGLCL